MRALRAATVLTIRTTADPPCRDVPGAWQPDGSRDAGWSRARAPAIRELMPGSGPDLDAGQGTPALSRCPGPGSPSPACCTVIRDQLRPQAPFHWADCRDRRYPWMDTGRRALAHIQ